MKKLTLNIRLLLCLAIALSVTLMTLSNYQAYKKSILAHIENVAILTSSNIYAEIKAELTPPLSISLGMAHDEFLKNWLTEETTHLDDAEHLEKITRYLNSYRSACGFNAAFLVSTATKRYYHHMGIFKIVGNQDPHDIWYDLFIKKHKPYDLDIDHDQADKNLLTIFINCQISDENGRLLGVTGVGVTMRRLREILERYQMDFKVKSCLVLDSGLVQAHPDERRIEVENLFDAPDLAAFKTRMLANRTTWETFWLQREDKDLFVVSRFIPELDWYLVVENDTSDLHNVFIRHVICNVLITLLLLALLLALTHFLISRFHQRMLHLVNSDELTGLPNRRAFNALLEKELNLLALISKNDRRSPQAQQAPRHERRRHDRRNPHLVIFDIDNFKAINDKFGHIRGDEILIQVGQAARELLHAPNFAARWGGDEFIGILYGDDASCQDRINKFIEHIAAMESNSSETAPVPLSVSVGMTALTTQDDMGSALSRADSALYAAKEQGRNRLILR